MKAILDELCEKNDVKFTSYFSKLKPYIEAYERLVYKLNHNNLYDILDDVNVRLISFYGTYTVSEFSPIRIKVRDKVRRLVCLETRSKLLNGIKIIDLRVEETLRSHELVYKNFQPIVAKSRLLLLRIIQELKNNKDYIPELNSKNNFDFEKQNISRRILNYTDTKAIFEQINSEIANRIKDNQVVIDVKSYETLSNKKLEFLSDLVAPADYEQVPYVQLKQLIAKLNLTERNPLNSSYIYMCEFYKSNGLSKSATVIEMFTEYSLVLFTDWLDKQYVETEKIKISTTKRIIMGANKALALLKLIEPNLFDRVYSCSHFRLPRGSNRPNCNTEQYTPFSVFERNAIAIAIEEDIEWADKFRKPYIPMTQKSKKTLIRGRENLQWLLDNKLLRRNEEVNFIPNSWRHPTRIKGKCTSSYRIFWSEMVYVKNENSHPLTSLDSFYIKTYYNISELVLPYLLKIAQTTGLNTEALSSLRVNSLISKDSLSGQPALYYFKSRSGGDKVLHLPLFSYGIQHVDVDNYFELKKCFDAVIELTKPLRLICDRNDSEFLFLFHSKINGKILTFDQLRKKTNIYSNMVKNFSKKYNLRNEKTGGQLVIVTGRFRPTLVSELIRKDVSIRKIAHILGHSSIKTTYEYLEVHDFAEAAKNKVFNAKIEIHNQTLNHINKCNTEKNMEVTKRLPITPMLISSCKNIMEPPSWIKESNAYIEGNPCSQFNQCLSCENVLITIESLPFLFAKKRELVSIAEVSDLEGAPYIKFVQRQLKVLDSILDVKYSDFTEEELLNAEQESVFIGSESNDPFGM